MSFVRKIGFIFIRKRGATLASKRIFSLFFRRIDRYIIKQFLGTYFFAIILILAIAIMFDLTEKLDKLMKPEVSLHAIIFDYYLNFIPYYANLFSSLFIFIAVIFFTGRMAQNTEITALLAGGMSFKRLLLPYMIVASFLSVLTFVLNSFVIPQSNAVRFAFENNYIKNKRIDYAERIQIQTAPNEFVFFSSYSAPNKTGYEFSKETFRGKDLSSRITALYLEHDTLYNWTLHDYVITRFGARVDTVQKGAVLDTVIQVKPEEFLVTAGDVETMTTPQLHKQIGRQKERGAPTTLYAIELHKRYAAIMTAFILTIIGVTLSSRKRRGGMGFSIAIGLGLSFGYILFMTVTASFAAGGRLSPFWASWLPNIIYAIIGLFLYKKAPK
ncbi:MAG: LptF/LptG family permease [Porphyromonas sp.]|nr:LptF/LptG family permease [Porphyromonas sp.]